MLEARKRARRSEESRPPRWRARSATSMRPSLVEVERRGGGQRFLPREMAHQPADVEDVEQLMVPIEIAEMIGRHEIDQRLAIAALWETSCRRTRRSNRPWPGDACAGISNVPAHAGTGTALQPFQRRIAIGAIGQSQRRFPARRQWSIGRDDDRRFEAGVVECGRREDRSRVVRAALEIRADLQRAVPQLDAAVRAGRLDRARCIDSCG